MMQMDVGEEELTVMDLIIWPGRTFLYPPPAFSNKLGVLDLAPSTL